MNLIKESPNLTTSYFKLNGKEVLLVFNKLEDVTTHKIVNSNWSKYKNIPIQMVLFDNSVSLGDNVLENIHIQVISTNNDILEVKIFGKIYEKFTKYSIEKELKNLTDCLVGYVSIEDFTKYTKPITFRAKSNSKSIEDQISDIAKIITHDGEYGHVYYNKQTKSIWWVASDALDNGDYDGEDDIKDKFYSLKGISEVIVELENFPDDEEIDDWEEIEY